MNENDLVKLAQAMDKAFPNTENAYAQLVDAIKKAYSERGTTLMMWSALMDAIEEDADDG